MKQALVIEFSVIFLLLVGQAFEDIPLVPDEPPKRAGKGARCNKVLLCTLFSKSDLVQISA